MLIICDTHVHIYRTYDLRRAFDAAYSNLGAHAPAGQAWRGMLFLTERSDCTFFRELTAQTHPGFSVETIDPRGLVRLTTEDRRSLYVIAGRQTRSTERLEVLTLGSDIPFDDDLAFVDLMQRVEEEATRDGLRIVLPWSPGKWRGRRGALIREYLGRCDPRIVCVGDTALRPDSTPLPSIFRLAEARGIVVVAGSDPLPLAGEESMIGRYATVYRIADDVVKGETIASREEALNLLRGTPLRLAGRRTVACAVRRWLALQVR